MVDQIDNIDSLKEDLEVKGQKVDKINILFLDISSACTGYSIASVDFTTKEVNFTYSGAIWLNPDWSHQEKYNYMFHAVSNYFWVVMGIDYIVVEQYSVNKKKMMGINVVSEMQGAIKAAAWENGVKVSSILPQTWRSRLGIKKNAQGDFKEPTKVKVRTYVQVPDNSTSNITGVERQTPNDLFDAIAIGLGWLVKIGFDDTKFKFDKMKFNPHVGYDIKGG